jgi:protein-L-isoaspartate(D-aspartate) O-methyltransferase
MVSTQGIGMTSQRARDRLVDKLRSMGIRSERVLEVIRTTPRHLFVDEALASRAYENNALPIGFGQTISQPYIVAAMTQALVESGPLKKVLEIGAGCGYQSVIMAQFAESVYSVERIAALANRLRARFHELGVNNVRVRHGDGCLGWSHYGPYDAVLVAAAAVEIPEPLLEQLQTGGRLLIPLGARNAQQLMLITKTAAGVERQVLDNVSFVPLVEGVD